MKFLIFIPLSILLLYLLYINGLIWIRVGSWLLFIGKRFPNGIDAKIKKGSGTLRKVIKLKEEGMYLLFLDTTETTGDINCKIKRGEEVILYLDKINNEQTIYLSKNERYHMIISIRHFSGEFKCRISKMMV